MIEKIKKVLDNDQFVKENFEELVRRYPRQMIIICHGEIFTGEDAAEEAGKKYPKAIRMILPVPSPEQFTHLL